MTNIIIKQQCGVTAEDLALALNASAAHPTDLPTATQVELGRRMKAWLDNHAPCTCDGPQWVVRNGDQTGFLSREEPAAIAVISESLGSFSHARAGARHSESQDAS